jgi:hypothetical protein
MAYFHDIDLLVMLADAADAVERRKRIAVIAENENANKNSQPTEGFGIVPVYVGSVRSIANKCARCFTTHSPIWRKGRALPEGEFENLCNACGIRYRNLPENR